MLSVRMNLGLIHTKNLFLRKNVEQLEEITNELKKDIKMDIILLISAKIAHPTVALSMQQKKRH